MKPSFSPKFFERISSYPSSVQDTLCKAPDPESVRAATMALHGKPLRDQETIDGVCDRFSALDEFYSHLIASKRFAAYARALLEQTGKTTARSTSAAMVLALATLSDPDLPYIHKLGEVANSSRGEPVHLTLVSVLTFYRQFVDRAPDSETILVDLIVAGDQPFLPAFAAALGTKGLDSLAPPLPADLQEQDAIGIARGLVAALALKPLSRDALSALRRCANHLCEEDKAPSSYKTQSASQVLLSGAAIEGLEWWQTEVPTHLVDTYLTKEKAPKDWGRVIRLNADVRPSLIVLAFLTRLDIDEAGLQLLAKEGNRSWEDHIAGYPDDDTDALEVGSFSGRAPVSAGRRLFCSEGVVGRVDVSMSDCFAIVVRLDQKCDVKRLINHECCLVVDGLDGLKDSFKGGVPKAVERKPVVFISSRIPTPVNHIVSCVEGHWRSAGLLATTPMLLSVDSLTSAIRVTSKKKSQLGHIAPSGLLSLPLVEALNFPKTRSALVDLFEAGLFLQTENVIIERGRAADQYVMDHGPALDAAIKRIVLTPEQNDQLFVWSNLDLEVLNKKNALVTNWPISNLLNTDRQDAKHRVNLLKRSKNGINAALATEILEAITAKEIHETAAKEFENFACALSVRPDIFLQLRPDLMVKFFGEIVQCEAVDVVAENLSLYASEICLADLSVVMPLFSVMATGLSPTELEATISHCATVVSQEHRLMFRLAEVHRRYATSHSLLRYMCQLHRAENEIVTLPNFRRLFARLLDVYDEGYLRTLIGSQNVNGIRDAVDFEAAFQAAVRAKDRKRAIDLVSQRSLLEKVNLLKWANGLRGLSNELRELRIPIDDIQHPELNQLHKRKILASVFCDSDALIGLSEQGLLDGKSTLGVLAKHYISDNGPLNQYLTKHFAGAPVPALRINGEGIEAVFNNAIETPPKKAAKGRPAKAGPLVSVIVSAFNPDIALFRKSIESILNQTHSNVEVFVIDDQSEKESSAEIAAVVKGYGDVVTLITMAENSGPYLGRNRAIMESKGDFIAIQDADDWSHPNRFELQLAAFEADPFVQILTAPHIRIDWSGSIQMEADFAITGDGPMTSMFRRSMFDAAGLFASVRSRGDIEMRERVRSYFGPHALMELKMPLMLCLADSQTLSQKTRGEKAEVLQIFRTNVSKRRDLRMLRKHGKCLSENTVVQVPKALRPPLSMIERQRSGRTVKSSSTLEA